MKKTNKPITYAVIVVIALVAALNYQIFIFPNKFSPSGLNGICTMIQHMFGISVGYLSLIINIPLAIAVYLLVSKPMAIRSMVYVGTFSVALLVLDEVYKQIPLFVNGLFTLGYLPLHLCSINIFVIAFHAIKPTKTVGNYLYTVCIPGAMAALLFPTWNALPGANYMLIHSFTVHILLALYPIVLTVAGEIKPELKELPKALLLLTGLAALALICNLLMNANFMFLMYAEPGNPLYLFKEMWGSHLLGFPVIIAGVLLVMHTPWVVAKRIKK